ncbi:replication protein A [Methanothrix sp.]|jgi:replication factor A1|uniref:replication protein A n=1 Tax=Methanothrix sp. TaxID=90426 RepID=UPI0025E30D82|nr:replication protein A [Methanothrix sp.]MCK9407115.1 replication protein A [Methanothrix sp.]
MKEIIEQISARLREQNILVPDEEIEVRLKKLIDDFRVPEGEARRSVLNYFQKEHGIMPQARASSEKVKLSEIKESGRWVDLEVKVLDLWEPATEAISQTGLVGDGSGAMKFVKWKKSELPDLVLGQSYSLKKVVTDEFQGRFSIKLNRTSQIEPLENEVEARSVSRAAQEMKVIEISEPGLWVDLKVKVAQLWEPNSDSISQSGLIGDETGSVKFVKWTKADLPNLEEGKSYLLRNLVTDEFQGRFSVKLNRTSQIEPLDDDIEIGSQAAEFSGALVDVQKGSGLIKRCPVCKRSLAKGVCTEHGKVDGTYDLRIKAVLDDGRRVQDVLINRETTERLVGLTLDEARMMAMEALDHEVVRSLIESKLVGRYFAIAGPRVDRYLLVETINELMPVTESSVEELISRMEAI